MVVEVMITTAIVGILGSVAATLMLQTNRYFLLTKTRVDLQKDARAVMYIISRELRQADADSITIDRAANQPYYSRITFTTIQGVTRTFSQSGTSLIMATGNQRRTLTQSLCYLAFYFPRSDNLAIVSVALTLQQSIYQGRIKALHMASQNIRVMN